MLSESPSTTIHARQPFLKTRVLLATTYHVVKSRWAQFGLQVRNVRCLEEPKRHALYSEFPLVAKSVSGSTYHFPAKYEST
jgi:hypothetical protein